MNELAFLIRCDRDGCKKEARHAIDLLCECRFMQIKECDDHKKETCGKVERKAWICMECWTYLDIERLADYD